MPCSLYLAPSPTGGPGGSAVDRPAIRTFIQRSRFRHDGRKRVTEAPVDRPRQERGREAGPARVVRASGGLAGPDLLVLRVHEIGLPRLAGGVAHSETFLKRTSSARSLGALRTQRGRSFLPGDKGKGSQRSGGRMRQPRSRRASRCGHSPRAPGLVRASTYRFRSRISPIRAARRWATHPPSCLPLSPGSTRVAESQSFALRTIPRPRRGARLRSKNPRPDSHSRYSRQSGSTRTSKQPPPAAVPDRSRLGSSGTSLFFMIFFKLSKRRPRQTVRRPKRTPTSLLGTFVGSARDTRIFPSPRLRPVRTTPSAWRNRPERGSAATAVPKSSPAVPGNALSAF